MAVDEIPFDWKQNQHDRVWQIVDFLYYMDINDNQSTNKWRVDRLPSQQNRILEVKHHDNGYLMWRESDQNNTIIQGGSFPPWMVVSVEWEL